MQSCSSSACSWALGRRLVFTLGALLMCVLSTQSVTASEKPSSPTSERTLASWSSAADSLQQRLNEKLTQAYAELTALRQRFERLKASSESFSDSLSSRIRELSSYIDALETALRQTAQERDAEAAVNRHLPLYIGGSAAASFIIGLVTGLIIGK